MTIAVQKSERRVPNQGSPIRKVPMGRVLFVLLVLLGGAPQGFAQDVFSFRPAARYAQHVPTPEALLGYATGEQFTLHGAVVRAVHAIAGASDRVHLMRYGETYGGRPLLLAAVSSPSNLGRLESIQAGMERLSDPRLLADDAERERLIEDLPAVVWLSFNVHGNEASGTEAALPALYHLAAAEDDDVSTLLDQVVVLIDPCLNPDGRDRYVNWFRSVSGARPNPDPQAQEHREPWPGGRVNHYYFDLNRDWAFLTQAESRARLVQYRKFRPQVHVDLHEMGHESTYFFFPAAAPINDNFPRSVLRFGELFGQANATAFDRFGWSYYTGEAFDLFYPGYGDSWPSLNGAIGMTYEQAGHSRAGLVVRRQDGTLLTLRDRAARHFSAALETVKTAARHRAELLSSFAEFFARAYWEGQNGPVREFILVPDGSGERLAQLVDLLMLQGIEVYTAKQPFEAERCHSHAGGPAVRKRFSDGVQVVPLSQPNKHLAKVLLEPHSPVRDNRFYDLSAWSLPLAFGVEAYWTETAGEHELERLTQPSRRLGEVIGDDDRAGYLVPWDSLQAPRFLELAHQAGLRVRVAEEPFRLLGREFGAGTLYLSSEGNGPELGSLVRDVATRAGVKAYAASTGLTPEGPDLGSDSLRSLAPVRIALCTGRGTSASSVGALRYLFDQRYAIPYTALPLSDLSGADLRPYNVLILPDGRGFRSELSGGALDRVEQWVRGGGTLIGLGGSAFALLGEKGLLKDLKSGPDEAEAKQDDKNGEEADEAWKPMRVLSESRREQNVPGTMLKVQLDPDHRLAFGSPEQLVVLMNSTRAFSLEGSGRRLGVFGAGARLSGFISPENEAKLEGQAYLAEVSLGRGQVLLFAGDPNFRGFIRGQTGPFLNAVYFFAQPVPGP